jgi:DDE superfamily endonuclease
VAAHTSIPHLAAEDHARLHQFRNELHDCLTSRPDALFELVDGLCQPIPVDGIAHLTLAPGAQRGHGSAYAALTRGSIDEDLTRDLLAAARPTDWGADFAVDTTTWPRPDAHCSPGRGYYHQAHPKARHVNGEPVVAGWNFSLLAALSPASATWTAPLDLRLRTVGDNANTVAAAQITTLLPRLGRHLPEQPLFVLDGGYNPAQLTLDLAGVPVQIAVRIRNDRVFFTRAPEPPARRGRPGRPRRHGTRFHCGHPASWPTPDDTYTADTDTYGHVDVRAWHHLHPEHSGFHDPDGKPTIVECTLIRIKVDRLPAGRGDQPNVIWLWWAGPDDTTPDLPRVFRAYLHRFRHRAHHPLRQTNPGLDHAESPHPRTGPTLELAGPGRLHPAPAGPTHRR